MWGSLKFEYETPSGLLWTIPCRVKPRPALPNHHLRSALFWDITRHRVVIPYHCFWTIYWFRFQRGEIQKTETKHTWSWQNLHFGRRGTPSITKCLKEAQYIGSRLYVCFQAKSTQTRVPLTFNTRMLDISNAACTPQWPNVRYI